MKNKYSMMLKILASTLTGIIGGSMLIPFMTLRLKSFGHSESEIGLWSSLSWIGLLIASPYVSRVNAKFGYRKTYIASGAASLAYVLLLFTFQNYYAWCVLHFLIGTMWALRWVTTESFINAIAPEDKRGKFIGIYGSLIWVALAIGPSTLILTGTVSDNAFYAAIALFAVSFFLNFLVQDIPGIYDEENKTKLKMATFFKKHKFVFAAAFIGGIFENGISPVSILYALSIGISPANAALVASAIGVGALAVQYPIGWVADKYKGRNHYITLSSLLLFANLLLFFAVIFKPLMFFSAFTWGVFGPAIYVIVITWLGNKYKKNDLVAVTSFIIFGYTLGGIAAPIISGLVMRLLPLYGFPALLCLLSVVIFMFSARLGKNYRIT